MEPAFWKKWDAYRQKLSQWDLQSRESVSVKTNAQGRRGVEITSVLTSILPRGSQGTWDGAGEKRADRQLWMGRLR